LYQCGRPWRGSGWRGRRRRSSFFGFFGFFGVVEPGYDPEGEPFAHALLPKQGVLVNHLQPE
jgi:hypothetical protein